MVVVISRVSSPPSQFNESGARSASVKVDTEGQEQLALLRRLGCELGQGFPLSAAVAAAELGGMPAEGVGGSALKAAWPPS